eukprot:scaffold230672_cov17-Tisochrysis_lutea.AAC.3
MSSVNARMQYVHGTSKDSLSLIYESVQQQKNRTSNAQVSQTSFSQTGIKKRGDTSMWTDTPATIAARNAQGGNALQQGAAGPLMITGVWGHPFPFDINICQKAKGFQPESILSKFCPSTPPSYGLNRYPTISSAMGLQRCLLTGAVAQTAHYLCQGSTSLPKLSLCSIGQQSCFCCRAVAAAHVQTSPRTSIDATIPSTPAAASSRHASMRTLYPVELTTLTFTNNECGILDSSSPMMAWSPSQVDLAARRVACPGRMHRSWMPSTH